jgi:hypothetical protein
MDKKQRELISREMHHLTVDEMLEAEVMKYCAQCGEKLPGDESIFAVLTPAPDEDGETEMTAVYCRQCVQIDPSRKKRINPHPSEE